MIEADNSKCTVGNFNTTLTIFKNQLENQPGHRILEQPYQPMWPNWYLQKMPPPPQKEEFAFFSSARGTFFSIDTMLGHKRSLNQFKKTEIILSIFSTTKVWNYKLITRKKKP